MDPADISTKCDDEESEESGSRSHTGSDTQDPGSKLTTSVTAVNQQDREAVLWATGSRREALPH